MLASGVHLSYSRWWGSNGAGGWVLVGCRLLVVLPIQHWLKVGFSHSALAIAMLVDWASDIRLADMQNEK